MYGVPIIIQLNALIYMVLFLQDGPKYDYSKGNYDQTRLKLTKIGRLNGTLAHNQSFTKIFRQEMVENLAQIRDQNKTQDYEQGHETGSAKDFFKSKLNRLNLLIFIILNVGCSFTYYLFTFYIKYVGGNFLLNQVINSSSQFTSAILAYFMN